MLSATVDTFERRRRKRERERSKKQLQHLNCLRAHPKTGETGVANDKEKGRGVEGPEAAVMS